MVTHGIHAALLAIVLFLLLRAYGPGDAWFPGIFNASRRSAGNSDLPSDAIDGSDSDGG